MGHLQQNYFVEVQFITFLEEFSIILLKFMKYKSNIKFKLLN